MVRLDDFGGWNSGANRNSESPTCRMVGRNTRAHVDACKEKLAFKGSMNVRRGRHQGERPLPGRAQACPDPHATPEPGPETSPGGRERARGPRPGPRVMNPESLRQGAPHPRAVSKWLESALLPAYAWKSSLRSWKCGHPLPAHPLQGNAPLPPETLFSSR